ncbi:MAG: substrate-binding domain-containing protein [Pirellulaceae bacterium]|nr:substrate-binding domain-containing protein [Pirellulaceae bacterium]
MHHKFWQAIPWLLAVVVLGVSGCGGSDSGVGGDGKSASKKTKRVILLTNGDDPFWDAMRVGMEKAQEEFGLADRGLTVVMDKNDATPTGQVDKLRQYLGQTDVAAVGISVIDPNNEAMASAMRQLQKQGVVVVTIDSDVNRDKFKDTRFAYLGTENTFGGRQMGLAAKALQPDGGKYAAFYGIEGVANVLERVSGFADGAGDKFSKAVGLGDKMDHNVARDNVRNALENHQDLKTLVGIWAYNADAIVSVVNEKKIRDQFKVVVFDAAPRAIQHLGKGDIDAMVVQNPYEMGYLGTQLMVALYEKNDSYVQSLYPTFDRETRKFTAADGDIYYTNIRVVVPTGSPLTKSDFDPAITFYTIEEFNQWLSERGLEGS